MLNHTHDAGLLSSWYKIIRVLEEKRFAKRLIKHLLESYSVVNVEKDGLSGKSLYREVLLHTQQVDPSNVDQLLWQAEGSVDDWTAPGREGLGFREVVHFLIMVQYKDTGQNGSVVSFRRMVNSLVPAHL